MLKSEYVLNNDVCLIPRLYGNTLTVLHTENVVRGGKLSFQNVGGAKMY